MPAKKTKPKDPKISILAREIMFRCQGFSKPTKKSTIIDRPGYDLHTEIQRLQKYVSIPPLSASSSSNNVAAMGRFLPAPGSEHMALCFYCVKSVNIDADNLFETVRKSRLFPSFFVVCCSKCNQRIFIQ